MSLGSLPDAVYTIDFDYYRTPQQLTQNTDELLIEEQFHDAVLYKAILYVAAEQDAPEGVTELPTIAIAQTPVA